MASGTINKGVKVKSVLATLPAISNGKSSVQISTGIDVSRIRGWFFDTPSTYSDTIVITPYFNGTYCRLTLTSPRTDVPQLTVNLYISYE